MEAMPMDPAQVLRKQVQNKAISLRATPEGALSCIHLSKWLMVFTQTLESMCQLTRQFIWMFVRRVVSDQNGVSLIGHLSVSKEFMTINALQPARKTDRKHYM